MEPSREADAGQDVVRPASSTHSSYLQGSRPTFLNLTVTVAEPPSGSEPKSTLEGRSWKPLDGRWGPPGTKIRQPLRTGPFPDSNRNRSHGGFGKLDGAQAEDKRRG